MNTELATQERAIEFLANEAEVSSADAASIYRLELRKLSLGARVTAYLSILAFRHARQTLRVRGMHSRNAD